MLNISFPEHLLDQLLPVREKLVADKVASRISNKDFTLWGKAAESESAIRLGWVNSASDTLHLVAEISTLHKDLVAKGINRIVLCGMGCSSLAPEVITKTAKLPLVVLDSTDPAQVQKAVAENLAHTAVVVSSKSGSTVETDSQKRLFEKAFTDAGIEKTERIFIVTDPGSPMEAASKADGYKVFNADPNVGGRYSALTAFGIVPSALAGVNIVELLEQAQEAAEYLSEDDIDNEAVILGAAMARTKSQAGFKNKLGIISDAATLPDFADWAEQLIAESTGKDQKGILPVVLGEQSHETMQPSDDLLLIAVSSSEEYQSQSEILISGELGEQFLLWEYATAIASRLIEVNPFDQPDVESAKIAARGMLAEKSKGVESIFAVDGIGIAGYNLELNESMSLSVVLSSLFSNLGDKSYVAIHAYLDRTSNIATDRLREAIAAATNRPTTFGWGPRFLHSTGQYHKGGPRTGVYIQLVSRAEQDVAVPGRDFTFGELISSQAAGDAKVLADLGRPVLTLSLRNLSEDIYKIMTAIG